MSDRILRPTTFALVATCALLAGCGGGGSGNAAPPELAPASATSFSSAAADGFVGSDWGFPTSGSQWYRDHQRHEKQGGSATEATTYRKRTSSAGTVSGTAAVLTTTETYDEEGTLTGTRDGAWAVGDNDVVYAWSSSADKWYPFAPAHVRAGQAWTMAVGSSEFGIEFREQLLVVSTSATSPNGYTGCIELDVTLLSSPGGTGTGLVHFDQFTGHTVLYVRPGVGTVQQASDSTSVGTVFGLPVDDHAIELLEAIDGPPTFLPTSAG